MGVYIKGMEMPRDGIYRMGLIVKEGKIKAGLVKEESFADKDIEWFDCVPVPPHGRLVDADALIKKMQQREDTLQDNRSMLEGSAATVALDMFAHTVIEAEG